MDIKEICRKTEIIASGAARYIMTESARFDLNRTESKGLNDFVSYVDISVEKLLVEKLSSLVPSAGFRAEEGAYENGGGKYCWIIDPLDGTTNFIHGVHPFAISIALAEDNEIIAGVVYEAGGKETFTAWKNGGAWLNGKRICTSKSKRVSDSLIATGFPYSDFANLPAYLKCLEYFLKNSHGIRRMGSASIDLSYVACGRFDGFFEYGLKLWDIAAGSILVREAGGRISDFSGNEKNLTGSETIAANSSVYSDFLEIVSKFML
jgi:myo-inositol-1(or 4)-monophosphatase